jgi:hypothetical protein
MKYKWHDQIPVEKFPELHFFVWNKMITISKARCDIEGLLYDMFQLPLSMIANDDLLELSYMLHNLNTTRWIEFSMEREQILHKESILCFD